MRMQDMLTKKPQQESKPKKTKQQYFREHTHMENIKSNNTAKN